MCIYIYPDIKGNILALSTPFLQDKSEGKFQSTTAKEEMNVVALTSKLAKKFKQGKIIGASPIGKDLCFEI